MQRNRSYKFLREKKKKKNAPTLKKGLLRSRIKLIARHGAQPLSIHGGHCSPLSAGLGLQWNHQHKLPAGPESAYSTLPLNGLFTVLARATDSSHLESFSRDTPKARKQVDKSKNRF